MALLDPDWLSALRERAQQPPRSARLPLQARGHVIGSVVSAIDWGQLANTGDHGQLLKQEQFPVPHWQLQEGGRPLDDSLAALAQALHVANLGHVRRYWRGERLALRDASGQAFAAIERGAVRPLGIATRAVHLAGFAPDGRIWVQQRSDSKANDPGLWDTLMGGMVSAQDDVASALARETWEEAGLRLEQLQSVERGGLVRLSRPSEEPEVDPLGLAYTVEDIDWFHCVVPDGVLPQNQDGEVQGFALLTRGELAERLHAGAFTLEAALVLTAALH